MFKIMLSAAFAVLTTFAAGGCKRSEEKKPAPAPASTNDSAHVHADGTTHDDHGDEDRGEEGHEGEDHHDHDEVALGTAKIGELEVELAQGHGIVAAGKEGHLVVKLPYNDKGASIVRAWIGTEDRLASVVGKGTYAPSHDDYDIHAIAPDPLPENVMWWIEIEKPDGSKMVGSAKPKLE